MGVNDPIPNAAYPTPGQGLTLDLNGKLPQAVLRTISGYEFSYDQIVTNKSVTATTEATADTVITGTPVSFDGATTVMVEFFTPRLDRGTTAIVLVLYDGSTSLGFIGAAYLGPNGVPVLVKRRLTPTAATKTYSVRAYVDAGTGTVVANIGGVANNVPAFLRITRT